MWSPGFKMILVWRENEKETKLTRKYKRMQYTLVNTGKIKDRGVQTTCERALGFQSMAKAEQHRAGGEATA